MSTSCCIHLCYCKKGGVAHMIHVCNGERCVAKWFWGVHIETQNCNCVTTRCIQFPKCHNQYTWVHHFVVQNSFPFTCKLASHDRLTFEVERILASVAKESVCNQQAVLDFFCGEVLSLESVVSQFRQLMLVLHPDKRSEKVLRKLEIQNLLRQLSFM